MSEELALIKPIDTSAMVAQVEGIQHLMKAVMRKDEHYGAIPGCGARPTLLKAGAEKLCFAFRMSPEYKIDRVDLGEGHREYAITCRLSHIESGTFLGEGVGLCSSMESRYRWRKNIRQCPNCGTKAIIRGKEQYGGGWICWAKKDGCGKKFEDDNEEITNQETTMENPDLADSFNTILKVGKKRALVDAVLTATAASDFFTQDIEDIPQIYKDAEVVDPDADEDVPYEKVTTEGVNGNVAGFNLIYLMNMHENLNKVDPNKGDDLLAFLTIDGKYLGEFEGIKKWKPIEVFNESKLEYMAVFTMHKEVKQLLTEKGKK